MDVAISISGRVNSSLYLVVIVNKVNCGLMRMRLGLRKHYPRANPQNEISRKGKSDAYFIVL